MIPPEVVEGDGPIILGQPHGSIYEYDIEFDLNETGHALADTDWHIERLYDGLLPNATIVRAEAHRYVIDVNRDPSGVSLYPGQNTTGLCPITDFDGDPIYQEGREPDAAEIEERLQSYHRPYHDALATQIERAKARHGVAILYDCHSIRSRVSNLFEGELPVFNIGTNDGISCDFRVEETVREICEASGESTVVNGRFKGGWTTRHHGMPNDGVHAIQMELAQRTYMAEGPPYEWLEDRASTIRPVLCGILEALTALAPHLAERQSE